jgi:hypothetical protein
LISGIRSAGRKTNSGRLLPLEHAGLLVECALRLGDVPDRLLEGDALLERQAPAERELAPPTRPAHAERAPLVQGLVIRHRRRHDRTRHQRDLLGGCPTTRRANSASLAGVANSAAAAT